MNAMSEIANDTVRYRAIFISDVHLGTRGCKAQYLLDFLKHNEADYVYLVGDIIDCWRLSKGWFWPQSHNDVVQKLLRKARKGTQVIYVPGNHDEPLRDYDDHAFGDVQVMNEAVHVTADGKRLLIIHGDAFDGIMRYAPWLARLGDSAYTIALALNQWFNRARHVMGYPYWSLSAYLKSRVKDAVKFIGDFEHTVAAEAKRRGFDGVVCGHIHQAALKEIDGIIYANDGDWVESCTALVEHRDGRLEIIEWASSRQLSMLTPALAPAVPAKMALK
ncbi:UDP-2,3-diacylglucosamine diphosphatase [Dongia mobilis]|jgi:UDP-2,3-diacylglucosamine pyrophosphatase LpxH|uniref:UDP-2,3-diacylglucosamine diphosphatase n=1 Tax=Dongia sp. TaxID=1977262 RepID=UPI0026E9BD32